VRRSLALIAVGAAVTAAAVVVAVGMSSSDNGGTTGAAAGATPGALPSGHPTVATTAVSTTGAGVQDAITRLEARSAADPGNVGLLLDLGDAYFLGQHLRQAKDAYTRALRKEPDNTAGRVGLAMVWQAQGDSGRAEAALRSVIATHPGDQGAHYSLAIVYFSQGNVGRAKVEWQAAARIDPRSTTGRRSQSFVDLLENQRSASSGGGD
jgi:cytochrome c-type biogenesis protein CcmH/NrfG